MGAVKQMIIKVGSKPEQEERAQCWAAWPSRSRATWRRSSRTFHGVSALHARRRAASFLSEVQGCKGFVTSFDSVAWQEQRCRIFSPSGPYLNMSLSRCGTECNAGAESAESRA